MALTSGPSILSFLHPQLSGCEGDILIYYPHFERAVITQVRVQKSAVIEELINRLGWTADPVTITSGAAHSGHLVPLTDARVCIS